MYNITKSHGRPISIIQVTRTLRRRENFDKQNAENLHLRFEQKSNKEEASEIFAFQATTGYVASIKSFGLG